MPERIVFKLFNHPSSGIITNKCRKVAFARPPLTGSSPTKLIHLAALKQAGRDIKEHTSFSVIAQELANINTATSDLFHVGETRSKLIGS
jgi:hypothetical protein